jgi:hypothetical protein
MNSPHTLYNLPIHGVPLSRLSAAGREAARSAHQAHVDAGRLAASLEGDRENGVRLIPAQTSTSDKR